MQRSYGWVVAVPVIVGLQLTACNRETAPSHHEAPAHVEHVEGTNLSRVTLTSKAMQRLDIQTAFVHEARVSRSRTPRKVVAYAAVLYDAYGNTWVYTRPEPQSFVRHEIVIEYIDGDLAVLTDGPPLGTEVVTVGGAELFGAEFEVGH